MLDPTPIIKNLELTADKWEEAALAMIAPKLTRAKKIFNFN